MSKQKICNADDLIKNSGICALVAVKGEEKQVAIFHIPDTENKVFAIGNWDPLGKANIMSRGIIGNIGGEIVVASPLYKQHFSLTSGKCLEEDASVPVYEVTLENDEVYIAA